MTTLDYCYYYDHSMTIATTPPTHTHVEIQKNPLKLVDDAFSSVFGVCRARCRVRRARRRLVFVEHVVVFVEPVAVFASRCA